MPKKLKDYLLDGGIRGRKFKETNYLFIYKVEDIRISDRPDRARGILFGKVPGTGRLYSNSLDNCLEHEEVD
jgi:hypothetical protein